MEQHQRAALPCCFPLFLLLERHKCAEETRLRKWTKGKHVLLPKEQYFHILIIVPQQSYVFEDMSIQMTAPFVSFGASSCTKTALSKTWNVESLYCVAFVFPDSQYAPLTLMYLLQDPPILPLHTPNP